MANIYLKTASMLFVIAVGFFIKKIKLVPASDARFLSKIIINVTLPCMIITNMNGMTISKDLIGALIAGFAVNLIMVLAAIWFTKNKSAEQRCIYLLSIPLYNISGFAVPMVQNFVSDRCVAAILLFNIGTAIFTYVIVPYLVGTMCYGKHEGGILNSFKNIAKNAPAMVNCCMLVLCLFGIRLPNDIISVIKPLSDANTALAMLSIGMLFSFEKGMLQSLSVIFTRLACSTVMALIIFFLPIPLGEARNAMITVLFVPMVSCAPILALEQGYKGSGVAVANSAYLPISVFVTTILLGLLF